MLTCMAHLKAINMMLFVEGGATRRKRKEKKRERERKRGKEKREREGVTPKNLYRYKLGKIIMTGVCIGISYGK